MKWSKLLTNLIANPTSAILDMTTTQIFANKDLYKLEIDMLKECLAVMKAQNIKVVDLRGTPVRALAFATTLPLWLSKPLLGRAEIIREKGTNRSRFFRGQVDKYTWVDIGSSYLPSDLLAAFLFAQFEQREKIQLHRRQVWEIYYTGLKDWSAAHDVQLPFIPEHCDQAYHMFYILLPTFELRQKLISYLRGCGIYSVFHYLPFHLSDMGQRFGGRQGDCPVTERVSDQLIRLPFHNALTNNEQEIVIQAIQEFAF